MNARMAGCSSRVLIVLCSLLFWITGSTALLFAGETFRIRAVNVSPEEIQKQPVEIPFNNLPERFRTQNLRVRTADGEIRPSQVDDMNADGTADTLVFSVDLEGQEATTLVIEKTNRRSNTNGTGPDVSAEQKILRNKRLEWTPGKIVNRQTGKTLLRALKIKTEIQGSSEWNVLAKGPLRSALGKRYSGSGFDVVERYVMNAEGNSITLEVEFTNTTDTGKKLPLRSWIPIWRNELFPTIEQVISPWDYEKTNRTVSLGDHPESNRGIGVVQHTMAGMGKAQFNTGNGRIQLKRTGLVGRHRFLKWSWSMKPYNVKPGETVRHATSFCFYNGESRDDVVRRFRRDVDTMPGTVTVHGQDGSLLALAEAPEYMEEDFSDLDRWMTGGGMNAEASDGNVRLTSSGDEGVFYTHTVRDLRDPSELRGTITSIADNTELTVTLTDLKTGVSRSYGPFTDHFNVPLLQEKQSDTDETLGAWWRNFAEKPEPFRYTEREISDAFDPWDDTNRLRKKFRVTVRLSSRTDGVKKPLQATLDRLSLSWFKPNTPIPTAPSDGAELPDLALAYTVHSTTIQKVERGYQIQVSKDASFDRIHSKFWLPADIIGGKTVYQKNNLIPDEPPEPGTYFWRVRAVSITGNPTAWSEPHQYTITGGQRDRRSPVREISARKPLFVSVSDNQNMWTDLPGWMKKHYASEPRGPEGSRKELKNWLDNRGPWPMILHYKKGMPLAALNSLVEQDKSNRVLGFVFGEKGIKNLKSMRRALTLGGRYGRYAGSLTAFHPEQRLSPGDRAYSRFIAEHSPYYLPIQKQNNLKLPFARNLAAFGMFVAGRADQWGAETEWGVGFKPNWARKNKPFIRSYPVEWMPPFLVGLVSGATVYRVEGFRNSHPCYAWRSGQFGPLWTHALRDFFRDILKHNLIPTREEIRNSAKVAVEIGQASFSSEVWQEVMTAIYGFEGNSPYRAEWMPNRSRYFPVPPIPAYASSKEKSHFEKVIRPGEYSSAEEVLQELNQFYPPEPDGNEAWSVLVGDTGVISNTVDALSNARTESFALELTNGPVQAVRGEVDYHQYLILKQKEDQLFVHANNYAKDRTAERKRLKENQPRQTGEGVTVPMPSPSDNTTTRTTVHFRAPERVIAKVKPESALEQQTWNGSRNELTVTVNHKSGVARIFVEEK